MEKVCEAAWSVTSVDGLSLVATFVYLKQYSKYTEVIYALNHYDIYIYVICNILHILHIKKILNQYQYLALNHYCTYTY